MLFEGLTQYLDEHPGDNQAVRKGRLDDAEKLDIALEGALMTSEPPQISAPKCSRDDDTQARQ